MIRTVLTLFCSMLLSIRIIILCYLMLLILLHHHPVLPLLLPFLLLHLHDHHIDFALRTALF